MNLSPLVSVCIASYNHEKFIAEAVSSVIAQSYANWELIIVDDASSDRSPEILQEIAAHYPDQVRLVLRKHNTGPSGALNQAIHEASGEFVALLGSDDRMRIERLQKQVNYLNENPRVSTVFTKVAGIDAAGNRFDVVEGVFDKPITDVRNQLLQGNFLSAPSVMGRRDVWLEAGLHNTELRYLQDYDLWLHILDKHEIARLDDRLTEYRVHGDNLSVNKPQDVAFACHYETAICALNAIQRWPLERLYSIPDSLKGKARESAMVTAKITVARLCLKIDQAYFQRPFLGIAQAYRYALEAVQMAPDVKIVQDLMHEVYSVLGDESRADGSGVLKLADWHARLNVPVAGPVVESDDRQEACEAEEAQQEDDATDPHAAYRKWIETHSVQEREIQHFSRRMMSGWTLQPSIHLLMTHVSGQEAALADTLDSLGGQLYGGWGLSIVSTVPCPDPVFEEMEMLEWHQVEGDLMDGVNAIVKASAGDWIGLLEAGTLLEPHMLYQHVECLHQHPEWRLVYMDEDRIDNSGERYDPLFKPEFNLELLRAIPYIGKFILIERRALQTAGAYGTQTGAESYEAAFRLIEQSGDQAVGHIPDVLVHQQDRFQLDLDQDLVAGNRRASVAAHLERCSIEGEAQPGALFGSCFVEYDCSEKPPVEIIVPVSGRPEVLELFLDSLLSQTQYPDYRVRLLVRDGVDIPAGLLARDNIDAVTYPESGIQWQEVLELARSSDSEYLMLMSPGAIAIQPNWLERLVAHFAKPDVAVVAPRLVSSDKTVVGGGIITGAGSYSVGMGAFGGLAMEDSGYMGRAQVAQELSAVSASCMLVRKSACEALEGVSIPHRLAFYQAVDFCLRVRESGGKIIWTPHSTLMFVGEDQSELDSFDLDDLVVSESEVLCTNTLDSLANDPAYNPNLSLMGERFSSDGSFAPPWSPHDHDLKRIIGFGSGSIGSWKFRVEQPLSVMHREQVANKLVLPFTKGLAQWPTSAELERLQVDTLLMHNTMHDVYMDKMEAYKKVNKAFMVFGQDDLMFALPPKNPFSKTGYKDAKKRLRRCLGIVDRVIVTTEPLAEELRSMADDVQVVPNYLDEAIWGGLTSGRATSEKPRVGWAGAQQHLGDLELLEEVVRETAHEVDWIFFGMCPGFLQPYVKEIHNPVTFSKYPEKLATLNLDLAVAPLEYNRFNDSKSNLRIVEYGALGWPVIASDIAPYREGPVCRVPNQPRAWIKAIRERIHDMDATRREGDILHAWVRENWMLQQHMNDWLAALDPAGDAVAQLREQDQAAG